MATRTTLTSRASGMACGLSLQPAQTVASRNQHRNGLDASRLIFPPEAAPTMRWSYCDPTPERQPSQVYGDRLAGLEQHGLLRIRARLDPVMQFRRVADGGFRRRKGRNIGNGSLHGLVALRADQRH